MKGVLAVLVLMPVALLSGLMIPGLLLVTLVMRDRPQPEPEPSDPDSEAALIAALRQDITAFEHGAPMPATNPGAEQ